MRAPLALSLVVAGSAQLRDFRGYDFESFLAEFGKRYNGTEYGERKAIFDANLMKVVSHNEEYVAGQHTWYAGVSELTDLTPEEFARLRSTKRSPSQQLPTAPLLKTQANPDAIDWREKGAVSKVKNQGGCGSCWAFSATETVESHYQIASGQLLTLAPQTYVNCVKNPQECGGTGGCEGATQELAFNLTVTTGIALESDMPYKGRDAKCETYKAAVKATGYVKLPANDADALETALATKGPIAVSAAAEPWQLYGGGIFSGCSKRGDATLDHGIQAVGYTKEYWIIRNSWGASWGEKGYIRISRAADDKTFIDKRPGDGSACKPFPATQTVGGECGILFDSSYPTGVHAGDSPGPSPPGPSPSPPPSPPGPMPRGSCLVHFDPASCGNTTHCRWCKFGPQLHLCLGPGTLCPKDQAVQEEVMV